MWGAERGGTSIFHLWTRRYFLTLLLGIAVVGLAALLWIRYSTVEQRTDGAQLFTEQLADRIVQNGTLITDDRQIDQAVKRLTGLHRIEGPMPVQVLDAQGRKVFPLGPQDKDRALTQKAMEVQGEGTGLTRVEMKHPGFGPSTLFVKRLALEGGTLGRVIVLLPEETAASIRYEHRMLFVLLGSAALLGWAVIYLMTKRMVRPIQQAAAAANQLARGDYDLVWDESFREKELGELMHSFQEMAARLKQMEALRTLLIAGVTHELKTPIASVSGLLQAVLGEVVEGEERREFLSLSLKETQRLQRMVEDLLDFNSFATGALTTSCEDFELLAFLREAVHQWQGAQESQERMDIRLEAHAAGEVWVKGDSWRVQQILINLLNNSACAMQHGGTAWIRVQVLLDEPETVRLEVTDSGPGIAAEDVPFIFERFYRGSSKKHAVRGLGLGLPFSRMLAEAQGGTLELKEASAEGATFVLRLPLTGGSQS